MNDRPTDERTGVSSLEKEIIGTRLQTAAEEIWDATTRLAFSIAMRDMKDASTSVMTPEGTAISWSQRNVPALSGNVSRTTRIILEEHIPPEDIHPGDVIVTNDPWIGSGHLPDMSVITPIFHDGELAGFAGTTGHLQDIGGSPGGWSTDSTQFYSEGVLVPPIKLYERGERNDAVETMIRSNVRIPDTVMGDIEAMRSGNAVGAERIRETVEEASVDAFVEVTEAYLQRSEERLRNRIRELDDGTETGDISFSLAGHDLVFEVELTVDGSDIVVDTTGSSEQVEAGINIPFTNTRSVTEYVVTSMLIGSDVAKTEGVFEPIEIVAPEGSILNCERPFPTLSRHVTFGRYEALLMKLLGRFVPDQAISEFGGVHVNTFTGIDENGQEFVSLFPLASDIPPSKGKDGEPGVFFPYGGRWVPIEVFEQYCPVRVERNTFAPDTEGAGEYRSAPAVEFSVHNPSDVTVVIVSVAENADHNPAGFEGGLEGKTDTVSSSVEGRDVPVDGRIELQPGETLTFSPASSGGYGDPEDRDEDLIERDVRYGYITEERAREVYGHEVDE